MRFHFATVMDRKSHIASLGLFLLTLVGMILSCYFASRASLVSEACAEYEKSGLSILSFACISFACVLMPEAFALATDQGRYVILPLRGKSEHDEVLYVATRMLAVIILIILWFMALSAVFLGFGLFIPAFRLYPRVLSIMSALLVASIGYGALALVLAELFRSFLAFIGSLLLFLVTFMFREMLLLTPLACLCPLSAASASGVFVSMALALSAFLVDIVREKNW